MQAQTNKDQDLSKTRRANPIHIVETPRHPGSNAEALRDVHMSLVRAEQSLFNLVQASHANGSTYAPTSFGYAAPQPFATGFAPGFGPGFAPQAAAWNPLAASTAWGQLAPGIAGTPPTVVAPGYAPQALAQAAGLTGMAGRIPACDISDEGKHFVCQLDLPGLRAEQIELLCSERTVVVVAYREAESEVASLIQFERGASTLQRTITLPNEILPGGAKATLSNGVLSVVLPKAQPTEGPHRIKVQG